MKTRTFRWSVSIVILLALVLLAVILSLCTGTARISPPEVFSMLFEKGDSLEKAIVFDIRLPRVLLGLAVGGALSLAGVILQGMFRNPLVEPYTLGISGGAALGVCLGIVFKASEYTGAWSLPACGFAGAAVTVMLVYWLSTRRSVLSIRNMLLTGVMISFISSSLVMLIMALSSQEQLHGIIFWIMGSLAEPEPGLASAALAASVVTLGISYLFAMDLNALSLGEDEAQHLGVNVELTKKCLFVLASVATGFSVSAAGVIGFVGLVVPHFLRMFLGSDHRILLVTSFLCGGAFLVFCDTLAKTIADPVELPVGVITGIVGGSIFVYALSRRRVGM
ncbi:MAG: iron ABC transporter permease [Kiritimatiellia bacterium]